MSRNLPQIQNILTDKEKLKRDMGKEKSERKAGEMTVKIEYGAEVDHN